MWIRYTNAATGYPALLNLEALSEVDIVEDRDPDGYAVIVTPTSGFPFPILRTTSYREAETLLEWIATLLPSVTDLCPAPAPSTTTSASSP